MNTTQTVVLLAGTACATIGSLGGVGGAVLLVPILVLTGMDPMRAAPIGMAMVAASSVGAAPRHISTGTVHHRLGISVELVAALGALAGAAASTYLDAGTVRIVLAGGATAGAIALLARRGLRNLPDASLTGDQIGEWSGPTLQGAYRLDNDRIVSYQARRVWLTRAAVGLGGVLAGVSGTSGGYLKSPAMSEIAHVPVRVAAATGTFITGITAAVALAVYSTQGRIDAGPVGAAVLAGLAGGAAGGHLVNWVPPQATRRLLSALLLAIAAILLAT